jgi:methylaspartate ammonia-lyase
MTEITGVVTFPSLGADYYEDLPALHSRPAQDSKRIQPGSGTLEYQRPGQILSVGLVLDGNQIAWGDCTGLVNHSIGGRDPVFNNNVAETTIRNIITPLLIGKNVSQFKSLSEELDLLEESQEIISELPEHKPGDKLSRRDLFKSAGRVVSSSPQLEKKTVVGSLRSGVLYGVSQALLSAVGLARRSTLTEIICREWRLPLPKLTVPLPSHCGTNWIDDAKKMIALGISSLPHAQITNIPDQLGKKAIELIKFTRWISKRIQKLASEDYHPTIHYNFRGSLGTLYENDLGKILGTIAALESAAKPYPLRIESPIIMPTLEEQVQSYKELREFISFRNMAVELVLNEWANSRSDIHLFLDEKAVDMVHVQPPILGALHNSIQACLDCKAREVGVLLGGSSSDTDISSGITTEIALAVQPNLLLAYPGISLTGEISKVNNQMLRTLEQIKLSDPEN